MVEMRLQILRQYTVFPLILTAAGLAAITLPAPLPVRAAFALGWLVGSGVMLGKALLPSENASWRAFFGTLTFAAATMVAGSATYLVGRLDLLMTGLLVGAMPWLGAAAARFMERLPPFSMGAQEEPAIEVGLRPLLRAAAGAAACVVALLLIGHAWAILSSSATDASIRSPWDVVPRMFFVAFCAAAALTFTAAFGKLAPRLSLAPLTGLLTLATGVAAATYKIGFGFDPFIHQATEKIIYAAGAIDPKPLYYIGQYVTVTVTARLLGGHVVAIDQALVPVALALAVPVAYWSMRKAFGWTPAVAAASASTLLLMPLSSFAATTPQGFANALFLMTAFLTLPAVANGSFPRRGVALLALAVASVHPLAGVPLLMFVAMLFMLTTYERVRGAKGIGRRLVLVQVALIGAVALPAVFVLNSWMSGAGVTVDTGTIRSASAVIEELQGTQVATRQFSGTFDLAYSWKAIRSLVILLGAAAGIWLFQKRAKGGLVYAVGAFMLLSNFILLKSVIRFPFLIDYERSNYADRIFELTLFLLLPVAAYAFGTALSRVRRSYPALKVGAIVLVAVLATSTLYLSYPRRDRYESSRGWSTSASDVEAVRLINKDAGGTPFVALANQSTSAAAVHEFGFKRYFASTDPKHPGPVFYYPIPTGDRLYELYLDMNASRGSRSDAIKAMNLAGTDLAYFAVSFYWWDAQRIIVAAKRQADDWWTVDDKVWVFKYARHRGER
jgi:hypothetical protein